MPSEMLPQGNKVKLTCQFKGREIEFQSIGRELFEVISYRNYPLCQLCRFVACSMHTSETSLFCCAAQRFVKDLGEEAVIENKISMQGRQMSMIIGKAASSAT